ncbi:hypothetical protein IJU97_01455 [bacterium]|nr:hypothetical protein [bacterium]
MIYKILILVVGNNMSIPTLNRIKMLSATATVTDISTSVTVNIPSKLNIKNNKAFESFLTDAINDYESSHNVDPLFFILYHRKLKI